MRVLDHAHDYYKLTKGEKNKTESLLLDGCYDLLERGHADLQPIFDKYQEPPVGRRK